MLPIVLPHSSQKWSLHCLLFNFLVSVQLYAPGCECWVSVHTLIVPCSGTPSGDVGRFCWCGVLGWKAHTVQCETSAGQRFCNLLVFVLNRISHLRARDWWDKQLWRQGAEIGAECWGCEMLFWPGDFQVKAVSLGWALTESGLAFVSKGHHSNHYPRQTLQ